MDKLKPCPYRVHGERTPSLTVSGEYYYNETFMPCMGDKCACYTNAFDGSYCRRDAFMFLNLNTEKGEQDG